MEKEILTRKELYDLVWSIPMSTLSKKYKISNNDLKKICANMQIPLPNSSYWSNLRIGKVVNITPLGTSYKGEDTVALVLRGDESLNDPLAILQRKIEDESTLPLVVPSKLSEPDKLIIQAKKSLLTKKSYGFRGGHVISGFDELSISVAPERVDRALLFMDSFIKLLRSRGHSINVKEHSTYVIVNNEKFQLSLREKNRWVPENDWANRYQSTGILILSCRLDCIDKLEWKDGTTLLEDQLSKILAKLEMKSIEEKERRLSLEKYWAEQEEKERIIREIQQRRAAELSNFKQLLLEAERWHKVTMLRTYINSLESMAKSNDMFSDEIKNRIKWSREKADWYDPMINAKDELLDHVDQNTFMIKKS
jgi:hypothetical protein